MYAQLPAGSAVNNGFPVGMIKWYLNIRSYTSLNVTRMPWQHHDSRVLLTPYNIFTHIELHKFTCIACSHTQVIFKMIGGVYSHESTHCSRIYVALVGFHIDKDRTLRYQFGIRTSVACPSIFTRFWWCCCDTRPRCPSLWIGSRQQQQQWTSLSQPHHFT